MRIDYNSFKNYKGELVHGVQGDISSLSDLRALIQKYNVKHLRKTALQAAKWGTGTITLFKSYDEFSISRLTKRELANMIYIDIIFNVYCKRELITE